MEAQSVPHGSGFTLPRSRRILAALGDERLVEQVRRGNDAAFEVLFDRHHRGILSFCRHMLASVEEAEDAVQHTFIQAYDSIRRSNRELHLKAWLYAIARNRCLSVLRARREQAAELSDIPTAGLSDTVQERSDLREMLGDIRELPEEQRAALVLSEIGDLSHAEIATVVGCEASKVKSLVFQARSSLIESRNARAVPCSEIREELATASGGALRRGPLRRHVKQCEGCSEFRNAVMKQRRAMSALIPVIPGVALKQGALAAVGIGGAGSAAAGGGLAGGGLASALGTTTVGKAAALVAVAATAVGGGVVVTQTVSRGKVPAGTAAPAANGTSSTQTPGAHGAAPGSLVPGGRGLTPGSQPGARNGNGGNSATAPHGNQNSNAGSGNGHAHGAPLSQPNGTGNGTATAPGQNGTAGQGQPDGVGNNSGTDNGNHTGAANGHANGKPSGPPGRGGRSAENQSSTSQGNGPGPKPEKPTKSPETAATPAVSTSVADSVPANGPALDAPGNRVGNKHPTAP